MDFVFARDGSDVYDDSHVNVALLPASNARIVDLAREHCTTKQWAEWLSVPLQYAASEGDKDLTEELLVAGANGDAISAAIRGGQLDLLDHLLGLPHLSINLQDDHLQLAVKLEDTALVAFLLDRGLTPFSDDLVRLAVTLGNEAIVSLLLEHGAEPDDSPNAFGWDKNSTLLLIAAKKGYVEIVRLLLDAGASADRRLWIEHRSPVVYEYYCGSSSAEEEESVTFNTESALDLAAIWGHIDVINAIIQHDPSLVNSVTESTGKTALLYAAEHHQVGVLDALVQAGGDLDATDKDGRTALHVALYFPDCEPTLRMLLKYGANVNAVDRDGLTPLCLAVKRGDEIAVDVLVSAGADVNISLLFVSKVRNEHSCAMIRTLVAHGADVNTRRARDGRSPLHLAAMEGIIKNVKILLAENADETALNGDGKTPRDVAGVELYMFTGLRGDTEKIKILLTNAARDRSWRLRTFFALCRKFPDRLRLQLPTSETATKEKYSPALATSNRPLATSRPNKKASKLNGDGDNDPPDSATTAALGGTQQEDDFAAVMDQLLGLQADVVFSTIIGFV